MSEMNLKITASISTSLLEKPCPTMVSTDPIHYKRIIVLMFSIY